MESQYLISYPDAMEELGINEHRFRQIRDELQLQEWSIPDQGKRRFLHRDDLERIRQKLQEPRPVIKQPVQRIEAFATTWLQDHLIRESAQTREEFRDAIAAYKQAGLEKRGSALLWYLAGVREHTTKGEELFVTALYDFFFHELYQEEGERAQEHVERKTMLLRWLFDINARRMLIYTLFIDALKKLSNL